MNKIYLAALAVLLPTSLMAAPDSSLPEPGPLQYVMPGPLYGPAFNGCPMEALISSATAMARVHIKEPLLWDFSLEDRDGGVLAFTFVSEDLMIWDRPMLACDGKRTFESVTEVPDSARAESRKIKWDQKPVPVSRLLSLKVPPFDALKKVLAVAPNDFRQAALAQPTGDPDMWYTFGFSEICDNEPTVLVNARTGYMEVWREVWDCRRGVENAVSEGQHLERVIPGSPAPDEKKLKENSAKALDAAKKTQFK